MNIRKLAWMPLAAGLTVLAYAAGSGGDRLVFKRNGYSIAPLEEAADGKRLMQSLVMYLPASDGFAPNVNVLIEPYEKDIDAFVKLSLDQFKPLGWKVLSEKKLDASTASFEYEGSMRDKSLHFYARAVKRGGLVYLTTATALANQWPQVSAKLKSCVDSFELKP